MKEKAKVEDQVEAAQCYCCFRQLIMGSCRNRQLQLDSPTRQQVVSNGKSLHNSPLGDGAKLERDKRVNSPMIKNAACSRQAVAWFGLF